MASPQHLFIHSLELFRDVPESDGKGGWTEKLQSQVKVRGRVWPAAGRDLIVAGQAQAQVTHAVVFPYGTDVKVGDVWQHGGKQYEVVIADLSPSVKAFGKCLAKEVQNA